MSSKTVSSSRTTNLEVCRILSDLPLSKFNGLLQPYIDSGIPATTKLSALLIASQMRGWSAQDHALFGGVLGIPENYVHESDGKKLTNAPMLRAYLVGYKDISVINVQEGTSLFLSTVEGFLVQCLLAGQPAVFKTGRTLAIAMGGGRTIESVRTIVHRFKRRLKTIHMEELLQCRGMAGYRLHPDLVDTALKWETNTPRQKKSGT